MFYVVGIVVSLAAMGLFIRKRKSKAHEQSGRQRQDDNAGAADVAPTTAPQPQPQPQEQRAGGLLRGAMQLAKSGVKAVVPAYILIDSGPRGY